MKAYERIVGIPGVDKVGMVGPGVYRSNRPSGIFGYRMLADLLGVRSVMRFGVQDEEIIKGLGLNFYGFPLGELEVIAPARIETIMAAVDAAPKPLAMG